jgi:hypothetical protein
LRRIASSLQHDLKRAVQLEQDLGSRLAQAKVRSGDVNSDLVTRVNWARSGRQALCLRTISSARQRDRRAEDNTANINVICWPLRSG